MKRTTQINQETFRKSWRTYRLAPLAVAVSAVLLVAGCEQHDQTVTMYQNADDCSQAHPSMAEQCQTSYKQAQQEAIKTAPKYATQADCVAEFGEGQCTATPTSANSGTEQTAQTQQSGGSWMPLLAGYMMGRMMSGGFAQQPLFTSKTANSPMNGKFVDATGRSLGPATYGRTTKVDKSAMAPKPVTTKTITRGGFGETVAKQNTLNRSSSATSRPNSRSSSRTMGG